MGKVFQREEEEDEWSSAIVKPIQPSKAIEGEEVVRGIHCVSYSSNEEVSVHPEGEVKLGSGVVKGEKIRSKKRGLWKMRV